MIIVGLMAVIALILFWLGVYVYGLYALGRWLANRFRLKLSPWTAAIAFGFVAIFVALPALVVDLDQISKATLLFSMWLLHAHPPTVGYWATVQTQRERDVVRWEKSVDEWVNEFEETPPAWLRELDSPDN
jgi:hypothetical protein